MINYPDANKIKVLVTGGTGFLGAYVIKTLCEKGYKVRAIRRTSSIPVFLPANIAEQVEWVAGDILDIPSIEDAMEGMDAVVHSAAKVSFVSDQRSDMFRTNIDGTANLVNVALNASIKRFIHVSSVAALGRTIKDFPVDENRKWEDSRLNTNYAISKFRGEMEVWRGIGEGLPAVIVNPSTIIGYGDWNLSSCAIFKSVYEGFPWYTNGVNGFVGVADVAKAIVMLIDTEIVAERFIVNGDNWSFRQLFDTVADGFRTKHPNRNATPLVAATAWRLEKIKSLFTGKQSLLTKESAAVAQSKTYFNGSKIYSFLPTFRTSTLKDTIFDACNLYLQHQLQGELAE